MDGPSVRTVSSRETWARSSQTGKRKAQWSKINNPIRKFSYFRVFFMNFSITNLVIQQPKTWKWYIFQKLSTTRIADIYRPYTLQKKVFFATFRNGIFIFGSLWRVDRDRSKRREAASEGGQKRPSSRQHRQHSHHTNAALQGQPATEKHERDISESVRSDPRYDVIFYNLHIRGCQLVVYFCQYR